MIGCMFHSLLALLLAAASATQPASPATQPASPAQPAGRAVMLKPAAQIVFAPINESSGLAHSRRRPEVFWTHNDSGDKARIFAIRRDGSLIHPSGVALANYTGIEIVGAKNVDWEDIAADGDGRLVIADLGNNKNQRRDLALYVVREPDPERDLRARVLQRLPVHFPEQRFAPDAPLHFDCEAVFVAGGRIHVLTKHRGDTVTQLYRLDGADTKRSNPLTALGQFTVDDGVTGADVSEDGRRLAVLTYSGVWMFEAAAPGDWLKGAVKHIAIAAGQCESICFEDDGRLLIGNEKGALYRVPLKGLKPYRPEPNSPVNVLDSLVKRAISTW